jgi:hypothetical protein
MLCNTLGLWYWYISLTAIGLTAGGSSTVHIYTQTVHRTTQWNRKHRTYLIIKRHKHNNKDT